MPVALEKIVWDTPLNTQIVWGFKFTERGYVMYQHTTPVRKGNPQRLEYTFRDRKTGDPIDLSNCTSVKLSVKVAGMVVDAMVNAQFAADKTTGKVFIDAYTLTHEGMASLQFVAYDPWNIPLVGDPAMVEVVKNNADLTIDELPQK